MDNYTRGDVVEIKEKLPFPWLSDDVIHMNVKGGSKITNLLGYAISHFKPDECRVIVFSGAGSAVGKTITCVEIFKRKFKSLNQVNKICYRKVEEFWEPKIPDLDRLKVTRELPAIYTLLSKDEIDQSKIKATENAVQNLAENSQQKSAVKRQEPERKMEVEAESSVEAVFGRRRKRKKKMGSNAPS